jgi:hypothetical protein
MDRAGFATASAALSMLLLLAGPATPAAAADHVVGGTQLSLRANATATRGALSLTLHDPAIPVPAVGSADDPSATGVTLTVFARGTGTQGTLVTRALPGHWVARTAVSGAVAYRFRDAAASYANANLLGVTLRTGRGVTLDARTPGIALGGDVRAVAVRVAWGATRVCTVFDVAAVKREKLGSFVARAAAAPALADCDDASLAAAAQPTCDAGSCPGFCTGPGLECGLVPDPVTPSCACIPVEPCPDGCPEGWICAYPENGGFCTPPFCDGTSPTCSDGSCEPGTECSPSPVGLCFCLTPCSGGDPYPTCGGTCPDPLTHCIANGDRCSCV